MKKNTIWMIIGCTIPLLLIFFAPALGLGKNVALFIFILFMVACHLLMPMRHGGHGHNHDENVKPSKLKDHEHH